MPEVQIGKVKFNIVSRSRKGKLTKEQKATGKTTADTISFIAIEAKTASDAGNLFGNLFQLAESKRAGAGEQFVQSLLNERFEHASSAAINPETQKLDPDKYIAELADSTAKVNQKKELDTLYKEVSAELAVLIKVDMSLRGKTGQERTDLLNKAGFPNDDALLARMTVLLGKAEDLSVQLEEIGSKLAEAQTKRAATKAEKDAAKKKAEEAAKAAPAPAATAPADAQ